MRVQFSFTTYVCIVILPHCCPFRSILFVSILFFCDDKRFLLALFDIGWIFQKTDRPNGLVKLATWYTRTQYHCHWIESNRTVPNRTVPNRIKFKISCFVVFFLHFSSNSWQIDKKFIYDNWNKFVGILFGTYGSIARAHAWFDSHVALFMCAMHYRHKHTHTHTIHASNKRIKLTDWLTYTFLYTFQSFKSNDDHSRMDKNEQQVRPKKEKTPNEREFLSSQLFRLNLFSKPFNMCACVCLLYWFILLIQ